MGLTARALCLRSGKKVPQPVAVGLLPARETPLGWLSVGPWLSRARIAPAYAECSGEASSGWDDLKEELETTRCSLRLVKLLQ